MAKEPIPALNTIVAALATDHKNKFYNLILPINSPRNIEDINQAEILQTLDQNFRNSNGKSLLHIAVELKNMDLLRCCIETLNMDVNTQDNGGQTALNTAVLEDSRDMAEYLILNKANVNLANHVGNSPLYTTLYSPRNANKVEMARLLLSNGANVDQTNNAGDTPLKSCVEPGSDILFPVADLLMGYGADVLPIRKYATSMNSYHFP